MNSTLLHCPDEIARILLKVIETAVLRIRMLGWNNQPEMCAREADHIHNLPSLISIFSIERLRYYIEVEVPNYLSCSNDQFTNSQKELWQQLQNELQKLLDQR